MDISTATLKYFVLFSELLASIIGTIFFFKFKHTYLRYFLFLLWFIFLSEIFAHYIHDHKIKSLIYYKESNGWYYNHWVYNVLDTLSFMVYYYIFYNALNTLKHKKLVKLFAILYILFSIINWTFIQNFLSEMQSYLFITGAIFLIISIILYFIELLKSEKILIFHKNLLFWISIGLLIYYAGSIPFAAEYNGYALIPGIHDLFLIVYILATTMYLTFTFGLIWSKKE